MTAYRPLLPLGGPPFRDVEAAARLWVEYLKTEMRQETIDVFWQSVYDLDAVMKRADELVAEAAAGGAA